MDPGDPLTQQVLPAAIGWGTYFTLYGPYVAILLLLLLLASLASVAEAAFFSLTSEDRALCRDSSRPADHRITALLERPKRLLASLVVLNNLLNIAIVIIVSYLTWEFWQVSRASAWMLTSITLATTLAIVLFGEIVPKVYASQNHLQMARRTAPLAQAASLIFTPLSVLLVSLSNQVDKRIQRRGYKLSMEELNQAVELTSSEATAEEREILKGIVNFSNLTARQVMRARMDITAFADDLTFSELIELINASGYSRVPVYKESIDQIEGILYIKDLLPHLHREDDYQWQTLLRPVFFIPETKKIDDLLQDFQKRRVHMAIVVDEYGGTRGLITLEDIIEEIFGDINDEFDEETPENYRRLDERTVVIEGKVPLSDVCRIMDVDSAIFEDVRGDSESLGGLLLELFNRLPTSGEEITYESFTFHVLSADDKRINEVRITQNSLTPTLNNRSNAE
ncbi:gliding motility-associated protein GldE [Nibrella viscosa]|uniref:Gliding motility-associated protein GldE n=1 Tax=Nibrella viscosa TaxID=1084524 RepID=A0ABP8KUJ4_9BACT